MTADERAGSAVEPPAAGIAAMRITLEFGAASEFSESFERALAKSGTRGATLVAVLDRGDLGIHVPHLDGPCWNSVPLFHLADGERARPEDWARTNAILEKLERYR